MDKYEYKHLVEQIQGLIDQGEYAEAAAIADRIDWRRVRSVMTLGTISDLYKINCRYEDARDIMLLAYDRKPENRQICYSLCELFIKTGEPVEAAEFYKEFEKLAPRDPGRYVLKYKLYDAYDVSLDEKIEVLEKLKEEEYQERWMYELANLYHRRGLGTKCVEVCDELILWFGAGKYVNMAMELKMLHEPLTPEQLRKYENRYQTAETAYVPEEVSEEPPYQEMPAQETEGGDKGDLGLAQGQDPALSGQQGVSGTTNEWKAEAVARETEEPMGETRIFDVDEVRRQLSSQSEARDEMDIQVKTVDVGQYNTMNLQAELAAGLKEVLENEQFQDGPGYQAGQVDPVTRTIMAPMMESDSGPLDLPIMEGMEEEDLEMEPGIPEAAEHMENSEVFFGTTGDLYQDESGYFYEGTWPGAAVGGHGVQTEDSIASQVMEQMRQESMSVLEKEAMTAQPPEPMAQVLAQDSDGQLRLVMPEKKNLEKQITGQLSIEDIRAEWERMKQESKAKQEEEVHQQVLRQTGRMFTEFEEAIRDNILKQMENAIDPASYAFPETPGRNAAEQEAEEDYVSAEEVAFEELPEGEMEGEIPQEQPEATSDDETRQESPEEEMEDEVFQELPQETAESEALQETEKGTEQEVGRRIPLFAASDENVETLRNTLEEDYAWGQEEDNAEESMEEESLTTETPAEEKDEVPSEEPEEEAAEEASEEPEEESAEEVTEEPEEESAEEVTEEPEEESAEEVTEEPEEEPAEEASEKPEEEPAEKRENLFSRRKLEKEDERQGIDFERLPREEEEDETSEEDSEDEGSEETADGEGTKAKARNMTKEEEELFASFIQEDSDRDQLVKAIDSISMAAFTGNVIITGDPGMNTLDLAKKMVYEVKQSDSNFSGKVAKIPGKALNAKDMGQLLDGLKNGALIVENASVLSEASAQALYRNLQRENSGIIVVLLDTRKRMKKFLKAHGQLKPMFNARVDLRPLSNDALAQYARRYAREQEYSIDNLGLLALHTKIDEMQTASHAVTYEDVREIMDDAIHSASRKTLGHFFDILSGKRYDDEDMIIITEKDFE